MKALVYSSSPHLPEQTRHSPALRSVTASSSWRLEATPSSSRTRPLWSETSTGTEAFFRVDSVTVAKADCKNGGWMNYGNIFTNQGKCLSLAT